MGINDATLTTAARLAPFSTHIFLLHARLSRSLATCEEKLRNIYTITEAEAYTAQHASLVAHLRRLGSLRTQAVELLQRVDAQTNNNNNNNNLDVQLADVVEDLCRHEVWLRRCVVTVHELFRRPLPSPTFGMPATAIDHDWPLSIIGAAPHFLRTSNANGDVVENGLRVPLTSTSNEACVLHSSTQTIDVAVGDATAHTTTSLSSAQKTATTAPSTSPSAEESSILADIHHAIEQLQRDGRQVNAMMQHEHEALQHSEELLHGGLEHSRAGMRDLDRLTEAVGGSLAAKPPPLFLRRLPGGEVLWHQIIAPLWAMVEQLLFFVIILAVLAWMLMIIWIFSKPRVFRAAPTQPVEVVMEKVLPVSYALTRTDL